MLMTLISSLTLASISLVVITFWIVLFIEILKKD
jgi:hypothetical protein